MKLRKTVMMFSPFKEAIDSFVRNETEKNGVYGLVPSHGGILAALYSNGKPLTMTEIATYIKKTPATTTALVNKLLDFGYITKENSVEDARVTYISLTQKGKEFRDVFIEISIKLNKKFHSGLSDLEADMLEKLLEKAGKNMF